MFVCLSSGHVVQCGMMYPESISAKLIFSWTPNEGSATHHLFVGYYLILLWYTHCGSLGEVKMCGIQIEFILITDFCFRFCICRRFFLCILFALSIASSNRFFSLSVSFFFVYWVIFSFAVVQTLDNVDFSHFLYSLFTINTTDRPLDSARDTFSHTKDESNEEWINNNNSKIVWKIKLRSSTKQSASIHKLRLSPSHFGTNGKKNTNSNNN